MVVFQVLVLSVGGKGGGGGGGGGGGAGKQVYRIPTVKIKERLDHLLKGKIIR